MRKCPSVVITQELRPYGGTVQTDIDPRSLIGRKAFDRNGTKIGTVDEVYLDDATGVPEWAAVRTGLFSRDAFVPLEPSEVVDDTLRVPFERSLIKDAPDFGVGRHLSPEQELQLYHHYGLDVSLPSDIRRDFGRLANGANGEESS
ncbi:PRC-barrel domain containing protein [Streptomyces sp. SID7760]|nr:PRC-barrel domain containing protein [Streptomyces sp. SID7760]